MIFIRFLFSSFWIFIGFIVILTIVLQAIIIIISRIIRRSILIKCGWPPAHVDSDGDAIKQETKG